MALLIITNALVRDEIHPMSYELDMIDYAIRVLGDNQEKVKFELEVHQGTGQYYWTDPFSFWGVRERAFKAALAMYIMGAIILRLPPDGDWVRPHVDRFHGGKELEGPPSNPGSLPRP